MPCRGMTKAHSGPAIYRGGERIPPDGVMGPSSGAADQARGVLSRRRGAIVSCAGLALPSRGAAKAMSRSLLKIGRASGDPS